MISIKKVLGGLIVVFFLAAAVHAIDDPLTSLDADVMKAMKLEYSVEMVISGQQIAVEVSRSIEKAKVGKLDVWRIISSSETPMGTAVDTFEVDANTLLPVSWRVRYAQVSILMHYEKNAVRGIIDMGTGTKMPVDVQLERPVIGDGSALETVLPALPLKKGYSTTLHMFDTDKQQVQPMSLNVLGTETVTVPAGTFETVTVELKSLDDSMGGGKYFINLKEPRCMIRGVFQMPEQAGGGTVTSELKSYK